jgi:hypothetical protein
VENKKAVLASGFSQPDRGSGRAARAFRQEHPHEHDQLLVYDDSQRNGD